MPVPSAVINVPTSADEIILSKRAFSTLRILPFNGSTAWVRRLRPCLAEPPAESPSTRNSSDRAGSFSWQSASLPGRPAISSAPLRRGLSGALRVAGAGGVHGLAGDGLALARMLQQERGQLVVDDLLDRRLHFAGDQFVLGLRGALRVR